MKHSIGILTTVTLIAAFVLSGCDSSSDRMESAETSVIEADQDLDNVRSELAAELQIYRSENEDRIMENNRTIGNINQRIDNKSDSVVRDSLEIRIDRYEETNHDLKREMDDYRVSGRDSWNDFKEDFSKKMDDLGDSLNDFFSSSGTASYTNEN